MNNLIWSGPHRFDGLVKLLLTTPDDASIWPRSRPGVYVIASEPWESAPSKGIVLYTGGTKNLLHRIGNVVRDLLGFFAEIEDDPQKRWVGTHTGAQAAWNRCSNLGKPVGELILGWAVTSEVCHWCSEREIAELFDAPLNKRAANGTCCCNPEIVAR